MTFEERLNELAKGQQELQEGQKWLTNSLNRIAEDFAKGQQERLKWEQQQHKWQQEQHRWQQEWQRERQQAETKFSNSLDHLAEVQANFEMKLIEAQANSEADRKGTKKLLDQALEAIARLANTAHAQNEHLADHDTRIDRLEGR